MISRIVLQLANGPLYVFYSPQVYVLKRPYVDEFLERMGQLYECVLFTASLAKVRKKQARIFMALLLLSPLSIVLAIVKVLFAL